MGPIYDRTNERLGTSDTMVIRTRKRLLDAAKALRDTGKVPPGVDDPGVYARGARRPAGGLISSPSETTERRGSPSTPATGGSPRP